MKIVLQSPAAHDNKDPSYEQLSAVMRAAANCRRPDTELVFNPASGLHMSEMALTQNLGARVINDAAVLNSTVKAAANDVDGLVIHCFMDPGLWAARQMLNIPVVGLAESAMGLATFLGRRFAILATSPRNVQPLEDLIDNYGHRPSATRRPVRAIDATDDEVIGWFFEQRIERLIDAVTPVARQCIADGADVLIIGCGPVSALLSEVAGIKEIDGVPFVTPLAAAVKSAEMLVDLKKGGMPFKSNVGFWGSC